MRRLLPGAIAYGGRRLPDRGDPYRPPRDADAGSRDATSVSEAPDFGREPVTPFVEVAAEVLGDGSLLWGDRSGVAIFDFDRDGDLDLYLANEGGYPNYLYRNDGNLEFSDVAEEAGVVASRASAQGS